MTRVGTGLWATFAVALTAALLSACGSSGSGSTGSTSTEAAEAQPETGAAAKKRAAKAKPGQQAESEAERQGNERGRANGGSPGSHVVVPLQVSGGGSGQFRVKGGDNSIQGYGDEADESELREVAEIVHDFYAARVEQEWAKACDYLSEQNVEQLEQLAERAKQKSVDCSTVLEAFTRTLPAPVEREFTTVDARSFRHDSEQGFLIYYGAGKTAYAMPLRAEDGTWKVGALVGTSLG